MGVQIHLFAAAGGTLRETTDLAGLQIATASRTQLVETLLDDHRLRVPGPYPSRARLVFDANGHALSLAAQDPAYREALEDADIIHADGGFLVTLSRFLGGTAICERSATTDMIHDIAAAAQAEGLSFYLLGGAEAVNSECAARLKQLYPGLVIAGRHHGYFQENPAALIEDIAASGADVVWVGLGKPYEQIFARELAEKVPATWIVTCGGCFNFVTGAYSRAPAWMQAANLEWLHRMASDPKRLFWRYAVTSPHAIWRVIAHRIATIRGTRALHPALRQSQVR